MARGAFWTATLLLCLPSQFPGAFGGPILAPLDNTPQLAALTKYPPLPLFLAATSPEECTTSICHAGTSDITAPTTAFPWGNFTVKYDNPTIPPNTGVTRRYQWSVSRGLAAPDGVVKPSLLINNQYPGPLIEANWGDAIEIEITNNLSGPEDGTSFHWHGLPQRRTPYMDGVPSVTQCPIAPGATFTYRFYAETYGTSWYHSHYESQYLDGLFGPIVIYGPTHTQFDEDLGAVLLTDYYHTPVTQLIRDEESTNTTIQKQEADDLMINGLMPFNCSLLANATGCNTSNAGYTRFQVESGKTYKLRLINAGGGTLLVFSIDNHNLTIIANDFVDVEPYETTFVTLGAGQRSDVLFTPQTNQSVWMRSSAFGKFCARFRAPLALAVVETSDTPPDTLPQTIGQPLPFDNGLCANDPLYDTVPVFVSPVPQPDITYNIVLESKVNASGQSHFTVNGVSFIADFNNPVIATTLDNGLYPILSNTHDFGQNTSIRINVTNLDPNPHPMHLHGHEPWILWAGPGVWNGTIINAANPQRRDTQNLSPHGSLVLQYNADNPGAWAFHCHIAFHLMQGLYTTLVERPDEIGNASEFQRVLDETCTPWNAWTANHVVDQIDSGLRRRDVVKDSVRLRDGVSPWV